MQGNPLSGWVVYANENVSDDFWKNTTISMYRKRNNRENLRLCTRTLYPYALEYLQSRRRSLRLGYQRKVEKVIQGALDRGMRLSFRVVVDSRDRKMKPLRPMYSMQEPNTIQTMENALPILMTLSSRRNMQSS